MQGQAQQQAYDRGITIFSPDGRLYQVEYAREAVKRGSASIGVRTDEGVVLVVEKPSQSPLVEMESIEKIHKIDDHVGIASSGHVADGRQLIDFARRNAQVERLRYEEPIGVEALTKEVIDRIQQFIQLGGARPFGVALLIGGIEDGEPRLFETDPSGTAWEWQARAIGEEQRDLQDYLEEHYESDVDVDGGIDLALRALDSVADEPLEATDLGVATVDGEAEQFIQLTNDEVEEYLVDLDGDA